MNFKKYLIIMITVMKIMIMNNYILIIAMNKLIHSKL
jgi:hypothetical protein